MCAKRENPVKAKKNCKSSTTSTVPYYVSLSTSALTSSSSLSALQSYHYANTYPLT